jgi:hypothetical protein
MYLGEALKQGKKARRPILRWKNRFLYLDDEEQIRDNNGNLWEPDYTDHEDVLADDWEPVKEVREVKAVGFSVFMSKTEDGRPHSMYSVDFDGIYIPPSAKIIAQWEE